MQTNTVFAKYETEGTRNTLWMVKGVYVAMNLLALALGIWKINGMGLLPYVIYSFIRSPLSLSGGPLKIRRDKFVTDS